MPKNRRVIVQQDSEAPVEKMVLVAAIIEMSKSMKALRKSGLNFKAIVVLTQHNCPQVGSYANRSKPNLATVKAVLESLSELEKAYTE